MTGGCNVRIRKHGFPASASANGLSSSAAKARSAPHSRARPPLTEQALRLTPAIRRIEQKRGPPGLIGEARRSSGENSCAARQRSSAAFPSTSPSWTVGRLPAARNRKESAASRSHPVCAWRRVGLASCALAIAGSSRRASINGRAWRVSWKHFVLKMRRKPVQTRPLIQLSNVVSQHNRQPLRRTGDAGIEPALAMFAKAKLSSNTPPPAIASHCALWTVKAYP